MHRVTYILNRYTSWERHQTWLPTKGMRLWFDDELHHLYEVTSTDRLLIYLKEANDQD